jgi:hypothetical protein
MNGKVYLDVDGTIIINGICINAGEHICNIGYACDACPYNLDLQVEERLYIGL